MAKITKPQEKAKTRNPIPNYVYVLAMALIFAVIYPFIFDKKVNLGGDNAGYYILGKALSTGQGYTDIHQPGAPAHNHFPPGYPVLLGIAMVFTDSIFSLKILSGLFLLGTALLLFKVFHRLTDNKAMAFTGAVLLLFNEHLLGYSTIMMSEVPYTFFASLAVLLFMNLHDSKKPFFKDFNFYGLLLVSSFAFHIRTAGIALVAGVMLFMLINKNWKLFAAYVGGFVALGLPWFFRGQSMGGSSYLRQLFLINPYRPEEGAMGIGDWFNRFGTNLLRYLEKEIPNGIFPSIEVSYGENGTGNLLAGIFITAIIIFGLIKIPRYRWLIIGYFAGSFGILLLWPEVWFGVRFVLPLIPMLLFLFVWGVHQALNLALNKMGIGQPNPMLFLVLIIVFLPQVKYLNEKSKAPYEQKFKVYFEVAAWANNNLPADAVISTRKPGLFYLFANRTVTDFANTPDYNEFFDFWKDRGVTHVVLDQLGYSQTGRYLWPAIQDNPEKFTTLHSLPNPDTYILSFNHMYGYTGEWLIEEKEGMFTHTKQGQGIFNYTDGSVYEGQWQNNQPNGLGTKKYPNGQTQTGQWENGTLLNE